MSGDLPIRITQLEAHKANPFLVYCAYLYEQKYVPEGLYYDCLNSKHCTHTKRQIIRAHLRMGLCRPYEIFEPQPLNVIFYKREVFIPKRDNSKITSYITKIIYFFESNNKLLKRLISATKEEELKLENKKDQKEICNC